MSTLFLLKSEFFKKFFKEGIEKDKLAEQISMAKAMKSKNMDINLISEITGLSIKEVEKL
ncbi:hypothetical protein [Brachyspira catarrhinii]|uniref:Transposase/invertase (TIGR01784 family) n=1 Tax=Brachyspira catarrhinii TaxID=2528966 RepID=A0ABY2TNI3_9SPIR|nr:hypothetical protein EZH24_10810 [Brachyspira catarrhinii]